MFPSEFRPSLKDRIFTKLLGRERAAVCLKLLSIFGLICLFLTSGSILIGYNPVSLTTLIVLLSLAFLSLSYYLLAEAMVKGKRWVYVFLTTVGAANLILVSVPIFFLFLIIGKSITNPPEKGLINLFQALIGFLIFSTIVLLPSFAASLVRPIQNSSQEKMPLKAASVIAALAAVSTVVNTAWTSYFAYMLLVFLFPRIYGLNT